ncbi:MAG: rRNA maturation RNase YbeY [Paludibacteraceae bacterium]|jgi:rRNA maturation RNase YbeY|nr:rRNA maturation RNase YbeY [Paludibacteraceae bacterium]
MITFSTQNVEMPDIDRMAVSRWINRVAAGYGMRVGNVNYLFCDDEHILDVNRQFLQHDYYTDIITFDYSALPVLNGDIIISLDTVRTNAQQFGVPYADELHRVIIHGVLHLTGQGDKTPETEAEMHRKEDRALEMLNPNR